MLYDISYANLLLFSKSTPTYEDYKEEKKEEKWDDSLDADNPDNFKNLIRL